MNKCTILQLVVRLFLIAIFSIFIIFTVLYNFEYKSVLLIYGENNFSAFFNWFVTFFLALFNWSTTSDFGNIHSTGQKLVFLQNGSNSIGVFSFVFYTFLYGASGLILAFISSTILTYRAVFHNSNLAKIISRGINFLSGIHIILFCFLIKIIIGHDEGFHLLILIAIAIGSYTYSDICQYQTHQFQKLLSADFITAARASGDSVFKHAKRSIAFGFLSQWNSLIGTVFASTIIVEYFFKIHGVGYALNRYLLGPYLDHPRLPVESEFFMIISALIIVIVIFMNGIIEILYKNLSKNKQ